MTASETSVPRFNPVDATLLKDPYPTYREYREAEPVHFGTATLPDLPGSWYLFRHEDNDAMLSQGELFANDPATVGREEMIPAAFRPVAYVFQRWLGGIDPPKHRALRSAMAKTFTPRRIAALEPEVIEITRRLVDEALQRSGGQIDIRQDVAFPLPMAVVGAALGVDEAVWPQFLDWSKHIVDAVDRAGDEEYAAKGAAAIVGMADYFQGLADERRDNPGDDLLSAMIAAAAEEGSQIDEFDMIAIATELGVAGHETTANSVTKSVLAMHQQPGAWKEFVDLPEEAMPLAIEELLRFSTPVQRQRWRWVTRDTEFGGQQFQRGDAVVGILGAANRDPEVFQDPDVIDFGRPNAKKHLTFGAGGHFCLGSHLARLELRVATRALATEMPNLELVQQPDDIEWNHNFLLPAPHELVVRPG